MNVNELYNASVDLDPPILNPEFPQQLHLLKIPAGESFLVGKLFAPQGKGPHPIAVFLHGFPGTQSNYDLAANLQELGYQVFIFHYRGAWGSKGEFSMVHSLEDVETVLAYIRRPETEEEYRIDSSRILLAGHSFGGFLALMTAAKDPEIMACLSVSGANFGLIGKMLSDRPESRSIFEENFEYAASFLTGYSGSKMYGEILEHFEHWNLVECVNKLATRPVLLIGAEKDAVVPVADNHVPLVRAFEQMDSAQLQHIVFEATGHGYEGKRKALFHIISKWVAEILTVKS